MLEASSDNKGFAFGFLVFLWGERLRVMMLEKKSSIHFLKW